MITNNSQPISKNSEDPALMKLFQDLQGNILKSHARKNVQLLFLKFVAPAAETRNWITSVMLNHVTSFAHQIEATKAFKMQRYFDDPGFCSFSISAKGYGHLEVEVDEKDDSFNRGMKSGTIIKDPKATEWETAYQDEIHAVLILAHGSKSKLSLLTAELKAEIVGIATVIAEENGTALAGEKEHFGFADGRSQPRFMLEDFEDEPSTKKWNPFAALELVLEKDPLGRAFNAGFTGDGDLPADDNSATHSYGSYLVFRKLEQDVDGWNKAVIENSQKLGIPPELFGAYAVGRFPDGTPVVSTDTASGNIGIENDFTYETDTDALKCPFHAHIRKANPRGETQILGATLEDERSRRIARRGIPYEQADGKKGLLFMCYQSNIVRQFDFMQNSWVDNTKFSHSGVGTDSTIGQGELTEKDWPKVYGQPDKEKLTFAHFVTMRGGEYFFTPPISFLKSLGSPAMATLGDASTVFSVNNQITN